MTEHALIPSVSEWLRRGSFVTVGTADRWSMFVQEFGQKEAPARNTVLLLHGFPESSFSFNAVMEGLLSRFDRVIAPDFLGFGFSDKPRKHANSLIEQADLIEEMCADLRIRGAHIIAHDMGDSVACEFIARQVSGGNTVPFNIQSVTLTNGGLVMDLARLRFMQRLLYSRRFGRIAARFAGRPLFMSQIRRAHGAKGLATDEISHMWEILAVAGGNRNGHQLIRYLDDRYDFEQHRWLPALREADRSGLPVHLVWGDADAVAPLDIAEHVKDTWCPAATLRVVEGGGHFLQIDRPSDWLDAVLAVNQA